MYLSSNRLVKYNLFKFCFRTVIHFIQNVFFMYTSLSIDNEIEAQNFACQKRLTAPIDYKSGSKFGSKCVRGETVAYIALSDDENVRNCCF